MDSAQVRLRLLAFTLTYLACLAGAVAADTSVVGSDGAVLRIQSGAYGELFPQGVEAAADAKVLALNVLRPGLEESFLVPQTESFYAESSATLYYEKTTDLTFLLWEGVLNGIHPLLYVATFNGTQWLDVIEVFGGSFTAKKDPQLVIRGDEILSFKRSVPDIPKRTVVFLVWSEEVGGVNRKRMVPLVLEHGTFFGLDQRLVLDDFLKASNSPWNSVDRELREALRLQPGSQGTSAVVGFLSESTNEIVTLGVELLPYELSLLAVRVANVLQDVDSSLPVDAVVSRIRGLILSQSGDFNPGSLRYMADEVEALVRSELGQSSPEDLPNKARLQIVATGARHKANGLAGLDDSQIIEVGVPDQNGVVQHVKITLLSRRGAPHVGGEVSLFLSRAGYDALIAWEYNGYVFFQESEGSSWGDREQIELSDTLTRDDVLDMLADRILNR